MFRNKIWMDFTLLLKSRLGRRICLMIFMAVTIIQTVMIIPVYFSYKTERIQSHKNHIKALLEVPFTPFLEKATKIFPMDFLNNAKSILKQGKIKAIAVYTSEGILIGSEQVNKSIHFRDGFNPRNPKKGPILNMLDNDYGITWMLGEFEADFIIVTISDFSHVLKSLSHFLRIISMVILCISLILSFLTLFVLEIILIRPILNFHSILTLKGMDINSSADEILDYERKDELGDIFRAFQKVWGNIKNIIRELQSQQLELEQINQKMENTIDEKTKNLVHANNELQKEIDHHKRSRQHIEELTKIPEQNENPIMRIQNDGKILYANSGSKKLILLWDIKSDMQVPEKWTNVARDVSHIGRPQKYEVQIGDEIFLTDFVPVAGTNYINMYSTNITQQKKIEAELNHITNHDSITNLPNKHIFQDRLSELMEESKKNNELCFVACLEIKDLEETTLISGHDYREDVFRTVAKRITQHMKLTSIATRIQAGRFLVGSGEYKNIDEIREFLQTFMPILTEVTQVNGQNIQAYFQMGVSVYPDDSDSARVLCKNAEMALYRATSKEANHIEFYHEKINSDLERHQKLTQCMEIGLKNKNEFKLVFQPQVDLKTMKITGSEVLIRWNHPELGRISPSEFIPISEKSDLILKIGEWVLRETCRAYHVFKNNGGEDLKFSVNLSMRQLLYRDIV